MPNAQDASLPRLDWANALDWAKALPADRIPVALTAFASLQTLLASRLIADGGHKGPPIAVAKTDPGLLRIREVAALLRYSVSRVYELVHSGELAAVVSGKSIRIRRSAIDAFLAKHEHTKVDSLVSNMLSIQRDRRKAEKVPPASGHEANRTG